MVSMQEPHSKVRIATITLRADGDDFVLGALELRILFIVD
jgi:hypothetical protein